MSRFVFISVSICNTKDYPNSYWQKQPQYLVNLRQFVTSRKANNFSKMIYRNLHFSILPMEIWSIGYILVYDFVLERQACRNEKNSEGGCWKFIKIMLTNLVSWLGGWFNWNRLKCPEILNRVEGSNANFRHK